MRRPVAGMVRPKDPGEKKLLEYRAKGPPGSRKRGKPAVLKQTPDAS
jgi:hypothetical protein